MQGGATDVTAQDPTAEAERALALLARTGLALVVVGALAVLAGMVLGAYLLARPEDLRPMSTWLLVLQVASAVSSLTLPGVLLVGVGLGARAAADWLGASRRPDGTSSRPSSDAPVPGPAGEADDTAFRPPPPTR